MVLVPQKRKAKKLKKDLLNWKILLKRKGDQFYEWESQKSRREKHDTRTSLKNVKEIDTVVKEATETAMTCMSKQQDEIEKRSETRVNNPT